MPFLTSLLRTPSPSKSTTAQSSARSTATEYHCEVVTSPAALAPHLPAWETLERRVVEDNFYFSAHTLTSAWKNFGGAQRHYVVLVYLGRDEQRRLVGCAAFSLLPRGFSTPTPTLSTFVSPHSYLSHPLLDRDHAVPALQAIWDWIEHPAQPWGLVRLQHMGQDAPAWRLIHAELTRRGRNHWVKSAFCRALLKRHESFDAFWATLSSNRRKSLPRRQRQLEGLGRVEFEVHHGAECAPDLHRRFMDVEARSWKGEHGTALSKVAADTAFFAEITQGASVRGELLFVELKLNGETIAMTSNFICGATLFAFKVGYDARFKSYSPGILAELETIRAFHDIPHLRLADSGTSGHSYLNDLWCSSREMQEIYTSTGRPLSQLCLATLVGATHAKRVVRARAKSAFALAQQAVTRR